MSSEDTNEPEQGGTPATLESEIFPNEAAILDAIHKAHTQDAHLSNQLSATVGTAVEDWLHQQGIDPENPPEHWRE